MSKSRTDSQHTSGKEHSFPLQDMLLEAGENFNSLSRGMPQKSKGSTGKDVYRTANMVFAAFLLAVGLSKLEDIQPIPFNDAITQQDRTKFAFVLSYSGREPMDLMWRNYVNGDCSVEPQILNSKLRMLRGAMYGDVQRRRKEANNGE